MIEHEHDCRNYEDGYREGYAQAEEDAAEYIMMLEQAVLRQCNRLRDYERELRLYQQELARRS